MGKTNAYKIVVGKPHGKREFWRVGHRGEVILKFTVRRWAINMRTGWN
jgi:hypothetical protein